MSLDLLKERFGNSVSTNKKEVDNREKINEKLIDKFNSSDIENLKSFKSQNLLDLLKERFGNSVSTNKKEVDNRKKLNDRFNSNGMENLKSFKKEIGNREKLNVKFDDIQNLKSLDSQHQGEIEEKERIIENLEIETSNLANQVLTLEKEKKERKMNG